MFVLPNIVTYQENRSDSKPEQALDPIAALERLQKGDAKEQHEYRKAGPKPDGSHMTLLLQRIQHRTAQLFNCLFSSKVDRQRRIWHVGRIVLRS